MPDGNPSRNPREARSFERAWIIVDILRSLAGITVYLALGLAAAVTIIMGRATGATPLIIGAVFAGAATIRVSRPARHRRRRDARRQ
jgi:hypothetical protein